MKPIQLIVPLVAVVALGRPPAVTVHSTPAAAVTIPFELTMRHLIVKVTVNNSRPLSFVLDTGASVAIIRTSTASELGLSLYGEVNTGGAGAGRQAGQRVKDATWSLVGLDGFSQPVVLTLPLTNLSTGLGRDADGIIGGEFIKQFVMELDYQARAITLHDRKTFNYSGNGQTLPIEFTPNGHPVVKATVTPVDGKAIEHRFMVDTGSGLALALHSPFVVEHNLLGSQSKTIRAIGMSGAGGTAFGRLGRVSALQIGSSTISSPITLFSEDKGGAFADRTLAGNIGAQVISRFRTIFDYGGRRMIVEPAPTLNDPFDRAMSGMAVRAEGPHYRIFRVKEVLEGSPATEAGIEEGDVIASIDGTGADNLTLTTTAEMLEKPAPHLLTILRGEKTLTVTLTPRRLV